MAQLPAQKIDHRSERAEEVSRDCFLTAKPRRSRSRLPRLVIRRLVWALPVMLVVIVATFALMHSAPGSPWSATTGPDGGLGFLSPATVDHLNEQYGLDQPWWEQLARYLANVVQFDFGQSYQYEGRSVAGLILESLPESVVLGLIASVAVALLGVGLGVGAALRRGTVLDRSVTGFATLAAAIPSLIFGILLILVASVGMNRWTNGAFYLPDGGFGFDEHLVLPVITLAAYPIAFVARITRASILDALGQQHVETARAKGLTKRRTITRHVLKNAFVPVVTVLVPVFGFLLTGTVVVEYLFRIPGVGGLFVDAANTRDYPVILGTTIFFAAVFIAANLIVDIIYVLFDPRIKVR